MHVSLVAFVVETRGKVVDSEELDESIPSKTETQIQSGYILSLNAYQAAA